MADFQSKYSAGAEEILSLVTISPMAWVISQTDGQIFSTPLPLRPKLDDAGNITHFLGHFARSNPQVAALKAHCIASLLFSGPNGYVSPSWMADRTQAPSWNYATVRFETEIRFLDDTETLALMEDAISAHEKGRPGSWSLQEMGPRYANLVRGVCGFEAKVTTCQPRFKMGQDEHDDVYADICRGMEPENPELVQWMRATNPGRDTGTN